MKKVKIVYSSKCLKYKDSGHPESPIRISKAAEYLKSQDYDFVKPKPASEKDILSVHNHDLVSRIKKGNFFEASTPNLDNIYKFALLSAGAAIEAASNCEKGDIGFSLMRPPGHHAEKNRLGGFCYFNNIAIAAKKLLDKDKKIAIIDFDCHHGQGTEDIFKDCNGIIIVSLHQVGIYPNTGYETDNNSHNFPLFELTGDKDYLKLFDKAIDEVRKFNPDVVAVSAGFDAYKNDPLTEMNLSIEAFKEIGKKIISLKKPVFSVLEGGYSDDLYKCIEAYLIGLES